VNNISEIVNELLSSVSNLKGISDVKTKLFATLGIRTVLDLLLYRPHSFDLFPLINSANAIHGQKASIHITQIRKKHTKNSKIAIFSAICSISKNSINLIFFAKAATYAVRGNEGIIRGIVAIEASHQLQSTTVHSITESEWDASLNRYDDFHVPKNITFVHGEFFAQSLKWSNSKITYKLPGGLFNSDIQKHVNRVIIPEVVEWIPSVIMQQHNFPSWQNAIIQMHSGDSEIAQLAIKRLAMDEAMFFCSIFENRQHISIPKYFPNKELREGILKKANINLTNAQARVLNEIDSDLISGTPMCRLVHGDVGSGKTIVAALSMVAFFQENKQVALLAPTEVLAMQHFNTFKRIMGDEIKILCLTSSTAKKMRNKSLNDFDIIIGTHALLEENVIIPRLRYVIIDEQHKFGVRQREILANKSENGMVHLLIMSATPIPRTMERAMCSMLNVSKIDEMPFVKDISTTLCRMSDSDRIIKYVQNAICSGKQGYWICPAVEENDKMQSAKIRYADFSKMFRQDDNKNDDSNSNEENTNAINESNGIVGMLHGRMKSQEKIEIMENFKCGKIKLLVATTAVEIGLDVPGATFIVIENSERFGLSQLHQLRGRIGRHGAKSECILLYNDLLEVGGISNKAANSPRTHRKPPRRLNIMTESNDGFAIAEYDLQVRGAGQLYGLTQSGVCDMFDFLDLSEHSDLITIARDTLDQYKNTEQFRLLEAIVGRKKSIAS
jgi:ATP-dependent DNA helicase RecG